MSRPDRAQPGTTPAKASASLSNRRGGPWHFSEAVSGLSASTAGKRFGSRPRGKSLRVTGNHVKPENQKYFAFPEVQTSLYVSPSRPGKRGVGRRHERGAGC